MKLIAKKPCSFGGIKFFIGDEIPASLVSDAKMQEKLGVIAIAYDRTEVSDTKSDTFFTQEQVDGMIATAVERARAEIQQAAELQEMEPGAYGGIIRIAVKGEARGENELTMEILAKPEEIRQVFSVMQLNAEEGAKVIADVTSENVLILLHAADSRKMMKDAAKKQADKLFSDVCSSKESAADCKSTGGNAKGVDT